MHAKRDKKDDEEAFGGNPFAKLQKSSALQEARVFNETPVNPRKCALTLTKILYLLNQGEVLSVQEATDAFFNMTRLFQCKDATLRRLLYLGIKELSSIAENVYVVTSSLTSDMNAKVDMCRPQALRTLCMITDATVFPGIERYMKQAIVDKNAAVASAALVSALHLARIVPEGVKRWVNEAQEAVNSEHTMVQHHALGLLYHIRKNDRLAVTKLVTKYINIGLKSNFAVCMLIRIAANLIEDEQTGSNSPYFDFIESCLRHKSEMVVYEAANAIVNLSCTTQKELMPAVSVLQLFLSSQKATLRFAAVRTLNKIAMTQPNAVMSCNVDLEILINDSNRSIATLAITTLLKTGHEGSVERLIKLITTFMSEISDEFKIIVVRATRQLCQKFPKKHNTMMHFLSNMLREEGGFEYKRCLVETIIDIIEDIPEAKEEGLSYLCEFIEDCEPVEIAIKILHLLGKEGPFTSRPSKYIRYVYNRLILETAAIRSAAVSALAKFGAHCDDLLPNIIVLLERSCLDTDDEVRDRATYYLNILKQREKELMGKCILNPFAFSISSLERALLAYLESNQQDKPFDLQSVPIEKPINKQEQNIVLPAGSLSSGLGNFSQTSTNNLIVKSANEKVITPRQNEIVEKLSAIDSIAELELGPLIKSSPPIELTESETEYVIHCFKHVFANHIVFQFDCTNTLNDQLLENVSIMLQAPTGFTEVLTVPCASLAYNVTGTIYNVFEYDSNDYTSMVGTFESVLLKFTVKDCDPITGQLLDEDDQGYSDEYLLEDVDMSVADYIQRLIKNDFDSTWNNLGDESEVEEVFALSAFKTIEEAIKNVICFMGMQPCDRTDRLIDSKNAFHHTLKLIGLFLAQTEVLVVAKLAVNINQPEAGVTMKLQVRCENQEICNFIASAVV